MLKFLQHTLYYKLHFKDIHFEKAIIKERPVTLFENMRILLRFLFQQQKNFLNEDQNEDSLLLSEIIKIILKKFIFCKD